MPTPAPAAPGLPPRRTRRAAAAPVAAPAAQQPFSFGQLAATTAANIATQRYGQPPRAAGGGGGGGSFAFTSRQRVREQIGPLPTATQAVRTMGGAFAGAAVATVIVTRVFPQHRVLTAMGLGVGSAVLAAASPVGSLAEDLGVGGVIASAMIILLDMTGALKPPTSTITSTAAAEGQPGAGAEAATPEPQASDPAPREVAAVALGGLGRVA